MPKPIDNKQVSPSHPPKGTRPMRVRNNQDARRLLGRLILQLQTGAIENRLAKDLTYLLISYVQIARESDLEVRLEELERTLAESMRQPES